MIAVITRLETHQNVRCFHISVGIYTVANFCLPNRVYYPQLKDLDEEGLTVKIRGVLAFAALELISLLVIGFLLQRKLGISMLRLLAFVLDQGWRMVQSNLLLWIFFTVESSIEHSGARTMQRWMTSIF
jgi:hypothetical protein